MSSFGNLNPYKMSRKPQMKHISGLEQKYHCDYIYMNNGGIFLKVTGNHHCLTDHQEVESSL